MKSDIPQKIILSIAMVAEMFLLLDWLAGWRLVIDRGGDTEFVIFSCLLGMFTAAACYVWNPGTFRWEIPINRSPIFNNLSASALFALTFHAISFADTRVGSMRSLRYVF